jgi:hypothetical protein
VRVVTHRCNARRRNANQYCKWPSEDIKQSSTQLRRPAPVFPKVVFHYLLQKSDAIMFPSDSSALAGENSSERSLSLSTKRGEIAWRANHQ